MYSRGRGFDSHPDQRLFSILGRKKFLIQLISQGSWSITVKVVLGLIWFLPYIYIHAVRKVFTLIFMIYCSVLADALIVSRPTCWSIATVLFFLMCRWHVGQCVAGIRFVRKPNNYHHSMHFFFLFIGQELTTWPANNCLQISVLLQIISCSCVFEMFCCK